MQSQNVEAGVQGLSQSQRRQEERQGERHGNKYRILKKCIACILYTV